MLKDKVKVIDGCWVWQDKPGTGGYGQLKFNGKTVRAHRLAYETWVGPIPKDKPHVLHKCDNPPCINPEHLFPGTHEDNMKDMAKKGRHVSVHAAKTHCPQGHEYNEINTRITPIGHRVCRVCDKLRQKTKRRNTKAPRGQSGQYQ